MGLNIVVHVKASFITTLGLDDGETLSSHQLYGAVAEHLAERAAQGSAAGLIDSCEIVEVRYEDNATGREQIVATSFGEYVETLRAINRQKKG